MSRLDGTHPAAASFTPEPLTVSKPGPKDPSSAVMHRRLIRRIAALACTAGLLAGCAGGGGLDLGDAPGQLVSEREVTQMSLQTWQRIKREETRSDDRQMQRRVDAIAQRITRAAGAGQEPWEVVVFEGEQVNAFALPGRRIGVYEGLVQLADGDAELAGVIAHEVGHVLEQHSQERLGAAKLSKLGVNAVNAALQAGNVGYANQIAGLLGAGAQYGVILPYGRSQELQADEFGMLTMAKAGYDPREAIDFWRKMAQQSEGKAPPEFASTHPAGERRIRQLRDLLPRAMEIYRRNA
jgi:predicted Zn-dependent protease